MGVTNYYQRWRRGSNSEFLTSKPDMSFDHAAYLGHRGPQHNVSLTPSACN